MEHSEDVDVDGGNIRMDLREIMWGRCGMNASGSGQGTVAALVKTVMNLRVP
jgi:hypothetical protein